MHGFNFVSANENVFHYCRVLVSMHLLYIWILELSQLLNVLFILLDALFIIVFEYLLIGYFIFAFLDLFLELELTEMDISSVKIYFHRELPQTFMLQF